jgi:hypothetical protein
MVHSKREGINEEYSEDRRQKTEDRTPNPEL